MFDPKTLEVYFIAGSQDIADGNLISVVEEALKAGITMYQFREKGETSKKGEEKEGFRQRPRRVQRRVGAGRLPRHRAGGPRQEAPGHDSPLPTFNDIFTSHDPRNGGHTRSWPQLGAVNAHLGRIRLHMI